MGKEYRQELDRLEQAPNLITIAVDIDFAYSIGAYTAVQPAFMKPSPKDVIGALVLLGGLKTVKGNHTLRDARAIYFKEALYHHHPGAHVWATQKQADAIQVVLDHIRVACKKWYEAGLLEGSNLLKKVAEGGIGDLNRLAFIRKGRE